MKWQIRGLNIKVNGPVGEYAAEKIRKPLERFARQVESIVLRFADTPHAHDGAPRVTKAMVLMHDGSIVSVEQKEHDFYAAIDVLSDRVRRAVRRHMGRKQKINRKRHGLGKRKLRGG